LDKIKTKSKAGNTKIVYSIAVKGERKEENPQILFRTENLKEQKNFKYLKNTYSINNVTHIRKDKNKPK
jgi:hypothetical protein